MPGRKILDEADARACLDAARASGLTRTEWAHDNGVNARSLNAWRLNLDRRDAPSRPVDFLELVPATASSSPRPRLRVRHGDLVVEVPADFDDDHLLRVLRVVAAC